MNEAQVEYNRAESAVKKYIGKVSAARTPAETFMALDLLGDAAHELREAITAYQRVVRRKGED